MANKTILMSKIRQILRLFTSGHSKVSIGQQTDTSRNTVKRYIIRFLAAKITFDDISRMSDSELEIMFGGTYLPGPDARYDTLQRMLPDLEKRFRAKGMTIEKLWRWYHEQCPQGYQGTQFHKYFTAYLGRAKPVMHMEHKAGDKMYVDYAGEKLTITDQQTGEVQPVEVFVAILGCSQLAYVEAVGSQRRQDFINACQNALHYFGGVPAAIVPDNLKAAVTRSSKYEPTINETFADFAQHYNTAVLPARAYRPRDKALVEGMVKIVYRRIYTHISAHTYFSLQSLNQAIHAALEELNNAPFKGESDTRRQRFEELEKSALQPLPVYRYELKEQALVTVMKNGHVCLSPDKHYYSVPYRFIGKKVKLLFTADQVEIFYKYERIAAHPRHRRKHQYTTQQEHLASSHRFLSEWTPQHFIQQAQQIDEEVAAYLQKVIENKQHPEQAYKSCGAILHLARKVGRARLIMACRRAHSYGVYNYAILLQILERGLDALTEEEQHNQPGLPEHQNIRGRDYYQ